MSDKTTTETAGPAVGAPVDRGVGRLVEERKDMSMNEADHIEQAMTDAQAAPRIQWPTGREAGRAEDMGQGYLRVVLDSDNDVCVAVWDGKRSACVEFCNPGGGGGGRSSRTRMALIALMVAIEADNAERPDLQRPHAG